MRTTGNRESGIANRWLPIAALLVIPTIALAQDPQPAPPPPAPAPEAAPAPAAPTGMIRPGMNEMEVRAQWGEPTVVKHANEWTYLFYRNFDERRVGFMDVVFLQNGQVVDCVARGAGHSYAGQSSSPADRYPEPTLRTLPADTTRPAVTGVRVNP